MENKPIKNCIYQIKSFATGKIYIGSAVNFKGRKSTHLRALEKGIHVNNGLQDHYNEYGLSGFEFSVLKQSTRETLIADEQFFIDTLNPEFNIARVATSTMGRSMQPHVKQSLIDSQHKIIRDEGYRKKMSESLTGRFMSEEHRAKIGAKHLGKNVSEHTRDLMSKSRIGRFMGADNPASKPVKCLNNGKIYHSGKLAASELGISDKHISSVCRGKRNSTHGYKFEYAG